MAVKRSIPHNEGVYFITFTCYNWLPLIDVSNSYDSFYTWFDYLKQQGHYIIGYQIMPNHVHVIIAFRDANKNINKIVGNGKRFIAYEIVANLIKKGQTDLLRQLEQAVTASDKRKGKLHEVWEDSFDWKECHSRKMIIQKLDYIPARPVRRAPELLQRLMESCKKSN